MKLIKLAIPAVLFLSSAPAMADLPGKHPGFLHALTDLRTARWFLNHQPGDAKVYGDEDVAITEIDAAIGEIKKAAIRRRKGPERPPGSSTPRSMVAAS